MLPWEDAEEYRALVAALASNMRHRDRPRSIWSRKLPAFCGASDGYDWPRLPPSGTDWRPVRALAEYVKVALVHLGAIGQCEQVVDAIRATQADTEVDIADLDEDEAMTRRAIDLLGSGRNDAYDAALAALREDTRQWWEDQLTGGLETLDGDREPYTADTAGLRGFLEDELLPHFAMRRKELSNRPLICQARRSTRPSWRS